MKKTSQTKQKKTTNIDNHKCNRMLKQNFEKKKHKTIVYDEHIKQSI